MPPGDPVPGGGSRRPRTDEEEEWTQSASDACDDSDEEEDSGNGVSRQKKRGAQNCVRALTAEVATLEQLLCPS